MTKNYLNTYQAHIRRNDHDVNTRLRLYVTNQFGNPLTTGEVFILGTSRSAELDNSGFVLIEDIPFGEHSFSLTTPLGTNTYGKYDFKKGKTLTFHIQVNTYSTIATPMVIDRIISRKR